MKHTLRRCRFACLVVLLAAGLPVLAWMATPIERTAVVPLVIAPPSRSLDEVLADPDLIPTHHHPLLGRPAPVFELGDADGKVWRLGELRDGRPLVLIFFYGFHCIHCVRHLSDVDRDLPLFRDVGGRVVAISADSPEVTRRRFEQYGRFGFPALADPGNKVARSYGVFRPVQDATLEDTFRHGTFIIDRYGTVRWVNIGDAPFRRNTALLCELAQMRGTLP